MSLLEQYESLDKDAIDNMIADKKEENLHLEFKTVTDSGFKNKFDRKNLATALSGFANSDGGLIIWGVSTESSDNSADYASGYSLVPAITEFIARLNELTGEYVSPLIDGVLHKKIPFSDDSGLAVTYVPASDSGPHMAKAGVDRYFKRSGDSFYRMEHYDIEDMFGRRKKPKLQIYADPYPPSYDRRQDGLYISIAIIFGIQNTGRGIAKHPFVELSISNPYNVATYGLDGNGFFGLSQLPSRIGGKKHLFGGNADVVVYPDSVLEITRITGTFHTRERHDLVITAELFAEGVRAIKEIKTIDFDDIIKITQ